MELGVLASSVRNLSFICRDGRPSLNWLANPDCIRASKVRTMVYK
jgi:hypothetical protein